MADWQKILLHEAVKIEDHYDALRYHLHEQLGGWKPIKILAYRGYGTPRKLYLKGRVIEDKQVTPVSDRDTLWTNLLNTWRRLSSDEVPGARVQGRFQDVTTEVVANEEGFFDLALNLPQPVSTGRLWHKVEIELVSPHSKRQQGPVRATGEVLIPRPGARYIVISDIDDTVIETNVANLLRMARELFLGNAYTRLPFPGVAAFYRALFTGLESEANPIFYVSSSPWNLYDLLSQFFHLHNIPIGPILFLRDLGLSEEEILPLDNRRHKLRLIRQMLDFYPHLPFVLIGDSGQQDPEIYAQIVKEHPQRVLAVYIRNVSRDLKRPEAIRRLADQVIKSGSHLLLADNTLVIARHAAEHGLISSATLPEIAEENKQDQGPPGIIEKLLGEEEGPPTPTVVVAGKEPAQTREAVQNGAVEAALKQGQEEAERPPTVVVEPEQDTDTRRHG